jgi:hypothetical protein
MPEPNEPLPPRERLEAIWKRYEALPFPKGFRGLRMQGYDFVLMAADMHACISIYRKEEMLDAYRLSVLALCFRHVTHILPALNKEANLYFGHLEKMAELVFELIVAEGRPD